MSIIRSFKQERLNKNKLCDFLCDINPKFESEVDIAHHWCENFENWNVPHKLVQEDEVIKLYKNDESFTQMERLRYIKQHKGLEVNDVV